MKRILVLLMFVLSGCVTPITVDQAVDPINANYPSAELRVNGEPYFGMAITSILENESLDKLKLEVRGLFEGTIQINSKNCNISQTFTYKGDHFHPFSLTGNAERSCIISIAVYPKIKQFEDKLIPSPVFKGEIFVKVLKDKSNPWVGQSSRIQEKDSDVLDIQTELDEDKVDVLISGCDSKSVFSQDIYGGRFVVNSRDFMDSSTKKTCYVEGALVFEKSVRSFSWVFHIYDQFFAPLPLPSITNVSPGEDIFLFDESVSILFFDEEAFFTNQYQFKFDESKPHTVRGISSKGRIAICDWLISEKQWECQN